MPVQDISGALNASARSARFIERPWSTAAAARPLCPWLMFDLLELRARREPQLLQREAREAARAGGRVAQARRRMESCMRMEGAYFFSELEGEAMAALILQSRNTGPC